MSTPFPEWLALLAQANKGPVTMPVAVRGQTYSHLIRLEGDWTGAGLAGSIRANPDSGTALANFTVGPLSVSGGYTTWAVSLSATQTSGLPADTDGDGVERFPCDFLLTPSGGSPERLFGGLFPLSGHITEPA